MDDIQLAREYGVPLDQSPPTPTDLVLFALEMAVRGDGVSAGKMLEDMSGDTLESAIDEIRRVFEDYPWSTPLGSTAPTYPDTQGTGYTAEGMDGGP